MRGNTVLEARDIEKAVYPYLGPDRTLSDIEAAREALQTIYQERGYQSVYVDLPEQQVADGIVFLQVSETKVGRVRGRRQHYSPLTIRDEVPALQEGEVPNFNRAQAELTNLNRGASRQVVPLVKEGRMPGTMDVDLKVEDKSPWHASVGLNNDYSADTKKLRSTASIGYDNLWQLGHSVSLTFFTAPQQTDNAKVWSGSYSMPLSNRWSLQFSGYKSDSNVATIGGTNVLGKGHSFGVSATYSMEPQGEWYNSLTMGIDYKKFDETTRFGNNEELIPLKYLPFTFSYNGYRYSESSQSSVGLSIVGATRSSFGIGSGWKEFDDKRYRASPSFALLRGDGTHTHNLLGDWQLACAAPSRFRPAPWCPTSSSPPAAPPACAATWPPSAPAMTACSARSSGARRRWPAGWAPTSTSGASTPSPTPPPCACAKRCRSRTPATRWPASAWAPACRCWTG